MSLVVGETSEKNFESWNKDKKQGDEREKGHEREQEEAKRVEKGRLSGCCIGELP